ncbi:MAG: DUF2628 domain-containing protein [Holosporaceae bacterium]|jgi:hypothetical protein|nr:DUF2628 domain-containing protein [Holosporaceae bacterium]
MTDKNKIAESAGDPFAGYYVSAFAEAEKGKNTWNWAAFFGGVYWLHFRKMYMFAWLYMFLLAFLFFAFKVCHFSYPICVFMTLLIVNIYPGFFGNKIYYRRVKKNIKAGYHLCDKYNPVSPWLLYLTCNILNPVAAFVTWLHDKRLLRKTLESGVPLDCDLTEKNINAAVLIRSADYYAREFKKIENGKIISLNWAACFGNSCWFIYRKMYLYGFLFWLSDAAAYFIFVSKVLPGKLWSVLNLLPTKAILAESVRSSPLDFWIGLGIMSAIMLATRLALLSGAANRLYYLRLTKSAAPVKPMRQTSLKSTKKSH